MISLVAFQAAIIAHLKNDAALTAIVGNEIREDDWQASNFTYPCVRVGGPTLGGTVGSPCQSNSASFLLFAITSEPSSLGCALLADALIKAIEFKTYVGTTIKTSTMYVNRVLPPTRVAGNSWRATIECSTIASTVV